MAWHGGRDTEWYHVVVLAIRPSHASFFLCQVNSLQHMGQHVWPIIAPHVWPIVAYHRVDMCIPMCVLGCDTCATIRINIRVPCNHGLTGPCGPPTTSESKTKEISQERLCLWTRTQNGVPGVPPENKRNFLWTTHHPMLLLQVACVTTDGSIMLTTPNNSFVRKQPVNQKPLNWHKILLILSWEHV